MKQFNSLYQLEQARQALMLADMPKHKKAAKAEQLGDYRHAQSLWKQVADKAPNNSTTQKYAYIRHQFCKTAVEHGYKRPELSHLQKP